MKAKAQVFQSGHSQAVRLPKAFRLQAKTVAIERVAHGLLITDDEQVARRAALFAGLAGSCPDFPVLARNDASNAPRDFE